MSYRLGGRNALAYVGVEPPQPPNLVVLPRPPTPTDSQNVNIGTFWVVPNPPSTPEQVWILVSLSKGVATWVQLYPGSGGGGANEFVEDVGVANALAGVINVIGGASSTFTNINTFGSGNTVEVRLNDTIQLPNTTAAGATGALFLGGNSFLHDFGANSTFVGTFAGNLTHSSADNTGIGFDSLHALTTATDNTAIGSNALNALTTGNHCNAFGFNAGSSYTSSESHNIVIDNTGTLGESNTIRIGNAANYQNCHISGIYTATIDTTSAFMVLQDNTEKLGAAQITSTDGSIAVTQTPGFINFAVTGVSTDKPAFLAVLSANTPLYPNSTSIIRYLGTDTLMTAITNIGSAFFIGDALGTPASFTAPITGVYQLNFTAGIAYSGSVGTTMQLYITTTARQYSYHALPAEVLTVKSITFSTLADMTAGDTATFGVLASISNAGGWDIAAGTALPLIQNPVTMVSGFLVA